MFSEHMKYLKNKKEVVTIEGKKITVFELMVDDDEALLDAWAEHLREHYCAEKEIDFFRNKMTRSEYLEKIKFPDKSIIPGPSVRAGDFTEILIADYVEFVLNYYVPRTRYDRKTNRNSSTMGSDLTGFKCNQKISISDELIVFEVKALASEKKPKLRLQDAIDHSNRDVLRLAESLNAVVQRLVDRGELREAEIVQRFQNSTDTPYTTVYAAAAVHSTTSFQETLLRTAVTSSHIDPNLTLLVIYCDKLMQFIHKMYRRACKC